MALTPKQTLFVSEYLIDFNAAHAAVRAGYSPKTAANIAYQTLRKAGVQEAIAAEMAAREKRTQITQDRVLQELANLAFFDPRRLFRPDGSPLPINELDDGTAAALAGLEVLEEFDGAGDDRHFIGYTKKYRIVDKNTALANAMRHLGMLREKVEVTGANGGPQELNVTMGAAASLKTVLKARLRGTGD